MLHGNAGLMLNSVLLPGSHFQNQCSGRGCKIYLKRFSIMVKESWIRCYLFKNRKSEMLYIGKKFLLLICFASGMLIGMDIVLNKNNCLVFIEKKEAAPSGESIYPLTVESKQNNLFIMGRSYFNRPIASTRWDTDKNDVLHIQFQDNNVFEVNVNQLQFPIFATYRLDQ